ncbi:hypothetical protein VMCG_08578 [Cytospora schulzeri]|uniref:Uncharacterized protein n=1 Tax=Cytospora schulzeri TaxID=448051 RepID=A0A423VW38_9PEZI|nr:hypothetical protein VMCG_08578 [Valsa malicola]
MSVEIGLQAQVNVEDPPLGRSPSIMPEYIEMAKVASPSTSDAPMRNITKGRRRVNGSHVALASDSQDEYTEEFSNVARFEMPMFPGAGMSKRTSTFSYRYDGSRDRWDF